jgi:hypothetical protein
MVPLARFTIIGFPAVDWRTFPHSVMGNVGLRHKFDSLAVFLARAYLVDEVISRGRLRSKAAD